MNFHDRRESSVGADSSCPPPIYRPRNPLRPGLIGPLVTVYSLAVYIYKSDMQKTTFEPVYTATPAKGLG